ncbi:MAG: hypothetical protein WBB44_00120 [Candidatus Nanopelagicales bacterium]|nr:hypothetical protein [Candidatus Nanopelagicales bacterium]
MTTVWAVLGGLLAAAVLAVCLVFFVVRPILARKVESGAEGLAKELHGRPPLRSSAASCDGVNTFVKEGVRGIGALGLTEQALVFVAGSTETSLIIPLDHITQVAPSTIFEAEGKTVRRAQPMLVVHWNGHLGATPAAAFTVDDALSWVAAVPAGGVGLGGVGGTEAGAAESGAAESGVTDSETGGAPGSGDQY